MVGSHCRQVARQNHVGMVQQLTAMPQGRSGKAKSSRSVRMVAQLHRAGEGICGIDSGHVGCQNIGISKNDTIA